MDDMLPGENDPQRDLLKLFAYGSLANFWITLGTKEELDEEEAVMLLQIQEALVKEFESTLQQYLDNASMRAFREYVNKFKVRISFVPVKPRIRYQK